LTGGKGYETICMIKCAQGGGPKTVECSFCDVARMKKTEKRKKNKAEGNKSRKKPALSSFYSLCVEGKGKYTLDVSIREEL